MKLLVCLVPYIFSFTDISDISYDYTAYTFFFTVCLLYTSIAFLKNEYGTGGSSPALIGSDRSDDWHDSKGIKLQKGTIGDPYAKVLLKWNVVEKRISELVKADKYLTPKGKEAYAQNKKEQEEEAMRREQEKLEHSVRVECKNAIEQAIADVYKRQGLGRLLPGLHRIVMGSLLPIWNI